MSELFRGLQNWADPGGKPKRDLDDMIDAYAKGGKQHAKTAEGIREVLMLSPDLNKRVLEAVRDGHLTRLSAENPGDNAAAGYNAHSRTMHIRPNFSGSHSAYAEMMFVLGHETDHARSLKGQNHATSMLLPAVNGLAEGPSVGPRDYTPIIAQYVERQRAEEAQAHIGGFNAMSSYVMTHGNVVKGKELEAIYAVDPLRMGDFISVTGDPAKYALKDGLSLDKDFQMPKSGANIEAMKGHYADKMIDGDYMMYRQEAIKTGMEVVAKVEKAHSEDNLEDRRYVINPDPLQAHRTLNLPADGQHEIKGAVQVLNLSDLGIDLGSLGPLVGDKEAPKPSVSLVPTQDDHPLFAQALTKVVEYHNGDKLTDSPQELRNLAAALAVEAHGRGLTQIDEVMLNKEHTGMIANDNSHGDRRSAGVDGKVAMDTAEQVSLAGLQPVQLAASSQSPSESHVQVQDSGGGKKL